MAGLKARSCTVIAAGVLFALLSSAGIAPASNEGFYLPKRIYALAARPKGWNLVALPARNPYQGPGGITRLCKDLNLGPQAQIVQIDGAGKVFAHVCGMEAPQFNLLPGRGLIIQDPLQRDGAIAGSDNPDKTITIFDLGVAPKGTNVFPVDYHTVFVTPEDLCVDCGLSGTAMVTRIDAQTGQVLTHGCGQVPSWNLVKGEAVLIIEDQGPATCRPSHL